MHKKKNNTELAQELELAYAKIAELENALREREVGVAEQAWAEDEALHRTFIEQSLDGIALFDESGRINIWNSAQEKITGISKAEAHGKTYWEIQQNLMLPESRASLSPELIRASLKKVFEEGILPEASQAREVEIQLANGERKSISLSPFLVKIGGHYKIGAMTQDITSRKEAELALQKNTQLLHESQRMAQVGSWTADLQTGIFTATPEGASLVGWFSGSYSLDEFMSVVHPDDREFVRVSWEAAMHGAPFDIEYRILLHDEIHWMRNKAKITFNGNGEPLSAVGIAQDITELRTVEDARYESDNRNRLLFQTMVQGVVFHNETGQVVQANPAAQEIMGLSLDQMMGRATVDPDWHTIHEDGSDFPLEAHPAMVALRTAKQVRDVVMGVYDPAKKIYRWVNTNSVPRFKPDEDKPYQVYTTYEDITTVRNAFEKLRESEERYRLLAENVSDVIWVMDVEEMRFRYVSPSIKQLRGYNVEETLAQSAFETLTPASSKYMAEILPGRIEEFNRGIISTHIDEIEQTRRDGSSVWTETATRFAINPASKRLEVYGVSRDITERKQAEDKLRRLDMRYRALIEHAPDGIVLINLDAKFTYLSPSVERMFGYKTGFDGNPDNITHPEDLPKVQKAFTDIIQQPEKTVALRYRILNKRGEWRWVESTFSNLLALPSVEAIAINFRDITEQVRSELEIQHRREDLELISRFNDAANRGASLNTLIDILDEEARRIYSVSSCTIYLTNPEGTHLISQRDAISPIIRERIEKLLGQPIPQVQIPILEGGYFHRILQNTQGTIVNDPDIIREQILEFAEASIIPPVLKHLAIKLIPKIQKVLNISSTLSMPLRVNSSVIGLIEFSSTRPMNESTLERVREISGQVTMAILRRKAEVSLKESNETAQAILNATTESVFLMDIHGNVLANNNTTAARMGFESNELIDTNLYNLLPVELGTFRQKQIESVIELKKPVVFEDKHAGRWYENSIYPIFNEEGQVWRLAVYGRDITGRKEMEAQLYKNEALLTEAQKIGHIGHLEWNKNEPALICSAELYNILGLPPGSVVTQQTIGAMMSPEDRDYQLQQNMKVIQQRQNDINYEYRIRQNHGTERWLHQIGKLVYDEKGVLVRMMAIVQDITERKVIEEKIRESEEYLRLAYEAADLGIWNNDLTTGVITFDERARKHCGLERNQASIEEVLSCVHADDIERVRREIEKGMSPDGPGRFNLEYRVIHPDGSEHWLILNVRVAFEGEGQQRQAVLGYGTSLDITERKTAEEALRESEEKYRGLMESLDSFIATVNADSRFLFMNDVAARQLGGNAVELIGRSMYELFPGPVAERQMKDIHLVIEQDQGMVYEALSFVNNSPRWYRTYIQPIHAKNGRVAHVLINSTDIHNLKTTQQELLELNRTLEERIQQRTAELQDLYDNAPAGYHSLDTNSRVIMINQTELNWLGYTREEIIGTFLTNYLPDESQRIFNEYFPAFMKQGFLRDLELEFIRRDGTRMPVLVNAVAIYNENGEYVSSRSTVFDNTERKQAETALRNSEEQNRLLFEAAPDAVVLFDTKGYIIRTNNAFEILTGFPRESILGRTMNEIGLIEHDQIEKLSEAVLKAFSLNNNFASTELKIKIVDDSLLDIGARIFALEIQQDQYFLAAFHDITKEKKTEEVLRIANLEMERALRLKDEFLANMSHELRTPLNAILGISESLSEQVAGPLTEKQARYINTIVESGQHLLELINDILDLAKINAGRIELDIAKTDIVRTAQSSLRMIMELAQKKNLEVKFDIDPEIQLVWVDERRLKQMLVNLLSNAVKFTSQNGHIGLEIKGSKEKQVITFTVWDTGIGIPASNLPLLFQPFMQLDAGLARGNQGTGLGLVLVSQMARLHGGSVQVISAPGQGTRFTISLPWVALSKTGPLGAKELHEKSPLPETMKNIPTQQSPKILLVEDTEPVTMLIQDYLEKHNYRVFTANNGYAGVDQAVRNEPDLILMDVMMPDMDGLETTKRIRLEPRLAATPIIALTALAMPGDRERCLKAGMNDYLSKPIILKDLLMMIEKHLAARRIKSA
ncbi:MAG TPA: PAS domain S-box protein [Anaerolineales bacterium]|nr:PAS domain S-box protein [Anaerolineales bacterium]